jgi:hypothetical protein
MVDANDDARLTSFADARACIPSLLMTMTSTHFMSGVIQEAKFRCTDDPFHTAAQGLAYELVEREIAIVQDPDQHWEIESGNKLHPMACEKSARDIDVGSPIDIRQNQDAIALVDGPDRLGERDPELIRRRFVMYGKGRQRGRPLAQDVVHRLEEAEGDILLCQY